MRQRADPAAIGGEREEGEVIALRGVGLARAAIDDEQRPAERGAPKLAPISIAHGLEFGRSGGLQPVVLRQRRGWAERQGGRDEQSAHNAE